MYTVRQKKQPFYFLNNCEIVFYFDNFWRTDTRMNLQQNGDKIIHLSVMSVITLPCETKRVSVCS